MHLQFDLKLTLDGLMTLIGGALALLGVWWSNHRSTSNLQKQLDAERTALAEERERQRRATAAALLQEVLNFRESHIGAIESLGDKDTVKFLDRTPFTVYGAVTSRIGEFDQDVCQAVVRFYSLAGEHLAALGRYIEIAETGLSGDSAKTSEQRASEFFQKKIKPRVDGLERAAVEAQRKLAGVAGVQPA